MFEEVPWEYLEGASEPGNIQELPHKPPDLDFDAYRPEIWSSKQILFALSIRFLLKFNEKFNSKSIAEFKVLENRSNCQWAVSQFNGT